MATSSGNDTVIVVLDRKCAKQVLLALTLALGGTPVKTVVQGKKGKGGKSGGGKASTSTGGGKASTSTASASGRTAKKKK